MHRKNRNKIEIDDLVNFHNDVNNFSDQQSVKSKTKKIKSKPQKKTYSVIKQNSQTKKDELGDIVVTGSSSSKCQKSSNKKSFKAQTNDLLHYQNIPVSAFDLFEEEQHEENVGDMWEQLTILNKKEIELKTAVLYEKIKQEEEFIDDEILLKEKISKLEDEVHKRKSDLQLKETMSSEGQLMETLKRISLPRRIKKKDVVEEIYDFSDGERGLILGHLLKKQLLKKELSSEQLEIAKMEENCWKMKLAIEKCEDVSASEKLKIINSSDFKELECLKTENQKRGARIQLLSKFTKYLIENVEKEHNLNDDLKLLASACEQIQHWNYEDTDELEELCKKVYSTKI